MQLTANIITYLKSTLLYTTLLPLSPSPPLFFTVPPNITHPLPDDPVHRTNNDPLSFIIEFNSKPLATTTVTWFHNNHPIQNGIETIFTSDYEGYSILTLSTVSRSNKGVYRVEVANNFSSIPEAQRTVSSSVELSLSGQPKRFTCSKLGYCPAKAASLKCSPHFCQV